MKNLVSKREIIDFESQEGLKCPIKLEYYILESNNYTISDFEYNKTYGISIVKNSGDSDFEEANIYDFSCSREKTYQLINLFADMLVTPTGLNNVMEDILQV